MLTFVIPTNNRPKELRICVRSIAEQIDTEDIEILILDNGSEPETGFAIDRLRSEYSFVRTTRYEDNIDYSVAFHRMMTEAQESRWVWTFGDDDLLMPCALKFMLEQLERFPEVSFIHVAEVQRSSSNGCYRGTLMDLCLKFGWLDMTGFITGNIVRGTDLFSAAHSSLWDKYAECSFVHSCALLEVLKDQQAVFLDLPLVNTQNKEQTQECLQRWIDQKIPDRYLNVSSAIGHMFDHGILTNKLPTTFFRYLTQTLWDRHLVHFIGNYCQYHLMLSDEAWPHLLKFSDYLEDEAVSKKLVQDVQTVQGMMTLHAYLKMNLEGIQNEILAIGKQREPAAFPYKFVEPPKE